MQLQNTEWQYSRKKEWIKDQQLAKSLLSTLKKQDGNLVELSIAHKTTVDEAIKRDKFNAGGQDMHLLIVAQSHLKQKALTY